MNINEEFKKSYAAGILIGISGIVYLNCENNIVGAFLFSFGLLTICELNLNLFTGMSGFTNILDKKLWVTWLGNFVGTFSVAMLVRISYSSVIEEARDMVSAKLTDTIFQIIIDALLCGVMMFIAVYMYKTRVTANRYIWIFLCVPIFILSGFEHSIADMFYFLIGSTCNPLISLSYILVVSLMNYVGSQTANKILINEGEILL